MKADADPTDDVADVLDEYAAADGEEEEDLPDVHNPGADIFPFGWGAPIPEGTIFNTLPIADRCFKCLNNHRTMHMSRNTYYPLACQTCGLKDTSVRFTCGSCWIRTCGSCKISLRKLNGDLHALLDHIATMPPPEELVEQPLDDHDDRDSVLFITTEQPRAISAA
jgi:hypothetical protein